jgi:ABC-type antimicrobial peptide transport system permease subunit
MCTIPNCGWNTAIHVYGEALPEAQTHGEEDHVGLGYFQTVGISLLQGRDFTTLDTEHSQKVAILNHAYARKLFGNANPIGRWVGHQEGKRDFLIVGEVADALVDGLRAPAPPFAYLSLNQNPAPVSTIVVRAQGSLQRLPAEIRDTLHALAPGLPITEIVSSDLEFHDGLSTEQLLAKLTSVFGALTLAMAALGFYGLLSFRLARRTSEIGIRIAVGATRAQVAALFLRQTMAILLAGAIPGLALALVTGHMARKLLYGAGTMDLWAIGLAFCVLAATGVIATLVPAHRAASIDPMQALRNE